MKKIFSIAVVLIFSVAVFAGCFGKEKEEEPQHAAVIYSDAELGFSITLEEDMLNNSLPLADGIEFKNKWVMGSVRRGSTRGQYSTLALYAEKALKFASGAAAKITSDGGENMLKTRSRVTDRNFEGECYKYQYCITGYTHYFTVEFICETENSAEWVKYLDSYAKSIQTFKPTLKTFGGNGVSITVDIAAGFEDIKMAQYYGCLLFLQKSYTTCIGIYKDYDPSDSDAYFWVEMLNDYYNAGTGEIITGQTNSKLAFCRFAFEITVLDGGMFYDLYVTVVVIKVGSYLYNIELVCTQEEYIRGFTKSYGAWIQSFSIN